MKTNKTKQYGLTLIEMMIAMLISLFLIGGVIQIFISSKHSYLIAEQASRLQENGRFAIDILTRDIRMAGFLPCRIQDGEVANSVDSSDDIYDFFQKSIAAFEGGVSDFSSLNNGGVALDAGSDAIRILRGGSQSTCVSSHVPASATIHLCADTSDFEKGDFLLVCDAEKAALFQMSGPNSDPPHNQLVHNTGVAGISPGNCSKFLGKAATAGDCGTNQVAQFGVDAQVVKFTSIGYFIGTSTSGTTTSLYRTVLGGNPVELIEDIESMQLLYGEDTNGDFIADQYVTGDAIVDSNSVVSVRVGLLVKAAETVGADDDTKTYNVAGTEIADTGTAVTHGGDSRLRAVYSATVKVRNRGIL